MPGPASVNQTLNQSLEIVKMGPETRYNFGYGNGFNEGFNAGLDAAASIATLLVLFLAVQVVSRNIIRHDGRFVVEAFGTEIVSFDVGYERVFAFLDAVGFAVQFLGVALIFVVTVLNADPVSIEVIS